MKRAVVWIVAGLCWLTAGLAAASEESRLLYSRGLVEFHAGRLARALEIFNQAVEADADDAYARYYRAVTRGRVGDAAGAISDLRAVLAAKPDLNQAALDLGVALVQAAQYSDAQPWLEQARRDAELDAQASLFLGITQLRLAQLDEARRSFERAGKDPAQSVAAAYYQAIIDYREGKTSTAEERFALVARGSPDSDMGHEAEVFLKRIREGQGKLYQLFGSVGFQYDSNVVLLPEDSVIAVNAKEELGISNQSDGRITLNAGGTVIPWQTERATLTVGYEFYQSLHFKLDKFNLQDHRPSAQVTVDAGVCQLGLLGRYDYYLLRADSFLKEMSLLPFVTIPEGATGRTELTYRLRRRDFFKPFVARNAFNNAPGIQQFVYLGGSPDRYLSFGYQFDRESPVVDEHKATPDQVTVAKGFGYDGNELSAGIGWRGPFDIDAGLEYAYRHEVYAPESRPSPTASIRKDVEHHIILVARRPLTPYLDLTAGYFGLINVSNDPRFKYERHIGSVALEVRFQ